MSDLSCYEPECENKVEVSCSCTDPPTNSCKEHFIKHCQSNSNPHNPTSEFFDIAEGTKEAMLIFLTEQKSKTVEIKLKILASFNQTIFNLVKAFEQIIKKIDADSAEISRYFEELQNIEKVSSLEHDPAINLLILEPFEAVGKAKAILLKNKKVDSFNHMRNSIDQAISSFNDEKTKGVDSESLLTLENIDYPELNFTNEEIEFQQSLGKNPQVAAIGSNNEDANTNNCIGDVLYSEKRYDEALAYYNDAIRIDPNCAIFYTNKAIVLNEIGRRKEAMECYQEAIRIDPNKDNAYNGIGNIFYNKKRYEEALNYFKDAIKINPKCAIYYINIGNALNKLNRREEAMESYQQAINTDPNSAGAYNGIGLIFKSENKYKKAIKYFNNAIRIDPSCAIYYTNKGYALNELGRSDGAIECYQQTIRIDPKNAAEYNNNIAIILNNEKRYDEAVKYCNEAIRIDPNCSLYYSNKAIALSELGRWEEAMVCFKQVRKIEKL